MHLAIRNLTNTNITVGFDKTDKPVLYEVSASASLSIGELPRRSLRSIHISPELESGGGNDIKATTSTGVNGCRVNALKGIGASWRIVPTPDASPCRIYYTRVSLAFCI